MEKIQRLHTDINSVDAEERLDKINEMVDKINEIVEFMNEF